MFNIFITLNFGFSIINRVITNQKAPFTNANNQTSQKTSQAEKNRKHNRARRSRMRELIKNVYETNDKAEAEKALKEAVSYIDRMSVKGIIHKNNAARKKSQLTNYVNNL